MSKNYYQGQDTTELEGQWYNDFNVSKNLSEIVAELYDSCDEVLFCEKNLCTELLQDRLVIETEFLKNALEGYKEQKINLDNQCNQKK